MSTTRPMPTATLAPQTAPTQPAPTQPAPPQPSTPPTAQPRPHWPRTHVLILLGLWLIIYLTAAFTPPLLDDADATHAQAAQAMLTTGDWVTLHVDGIRYLEKPPLPYWITAVGLKLFAPAPPNNQQNPISQHNAPNQWDNRAAFAVHFPLALTILGLALLGYAWSHRAFTNTDQHAALYTGIFILTSAGVFLFTRVFIPDAPLSLLLAFTLYALLRSIASPTKPSPSAQDPGAPSSTAALGGQGGVSFAVANDRSPSHQQSSTLWPYLMWISLALAVLTKGLVAIIFVLTTTLLFLYWTNQLHRWRKLKPLTGILLFLAIAAPWHILAGLRNTGGSNGHGFFWFYFINEHVLRFLGRRIPRDYNKLPATLYWTLHLVWLFPWSLFTPAALIVAWRKRRDIASRTTPTFKHQTILLLTIFSALVLAFFSLSTNQEYYTFPIYLPLLMLLAASLTSIERNTRTTEAQDPTLRRALTFTFATYTLLGLAISAALAYGLWSARHLPFVPDIGDLLAHRNVGDYTLSMSHFFDLTGPSFAALRLPASLALIAFLIGPAIAWAFYSRRRFLPAILTIAATSTIFLVAAHIAFVRFNPMLSSVNFAETIQTLESTHQISPNNEILIFGDQAFGSSIPFYLNRRVDLVDGRTTSMLFGSTFPDAPHLYLTSADLLAQWGTGPRKLLFVPLEKRDEADHLLGPHQIILQQTSGKALITDRPLNQP
jgi:4-amino-4-deoxy-L-arabinose transferase-like glycosyltransferase